MKRLATTVLAGAMLLTLCACGAKTDSDLQEKYDALLAENDDLTAENADLQSEIDRLTLENESLQLDLDALEAEAEAEKEAAAGALADPADAVIVSDDEYCTIRFLGCEVDKYDDQQLVFYIDNKTSVELTFQSDSMSMDGMSLGYIGGSDTVAPMSAGNIRFTAEEDFPTMTPSKISGSISVIDFDKTLFGKLSYDVSFVDLDVSGGAAASAASDSGEAPALSDLVGTVETSLNNSATDDLTFSVSVDGDGLAVLASMPGFALSLDDFRAQMSGKEDSWNDMLADLCSIPDYVSTICSLYGASDVPVSFSFVSASDPSVVYAEVSGSEVTYNCLVD